jgi:hypothetical protein
MSHHPTASKLLSSFQNNWDLQPSHSIVNYDWIFTLIKEEGDVKPRELK